MTEGNLINANSTLLTTIVAVDRMDVGFDVDENTLQRIQQAVREGKVKTPAPGEIPAEPGCRSTAQPPTPCTGRSTSRTTSRPEDRDHSHEGPVR